MGDFFSWIKSRLSHRPDSEHGQALVRIALFLGVILYMLVGGAYGSLPPSVFRTAIWMSLVGLGIGASLFAWILARPGKSDVRRIIGMVADYSLMSVAMALKGEPLAWLYVILMWVTVGNGLRYGNRYLFGAVAMACAGFGVVLFSNAYWRENLSLGIGLWIGLIAVPMYLSGLLRQLTRATEEARRANEAKSRFLANMSHEFRTPLNGLSGMSDLLATTSLNAEQRECLSTIQASTRSMLALVEDVLDISAIEAGKLKLSLSDFSPKELVDSIGLILLPQARAKQLSYEVHVEQEVPALLRGDARHLRQILLNLAGNAVKFTEAGSVRLNVSVIADAEAKDDGKTRLRFTVADTGIGIPADARMRLFEAFEQADTSLRRRHGGTGLGTTIAKGLAEAMGGSIGFESIEESGSVFWVELPFDAPVPVRPRDAVPVTMDVDEAVPSSHPENVIAFSDPFLRHRARVRSLQLLVADDHEANRMVLQRLLQKAGHRVVCVDSGEAVLDALEISDYDTVICDLHMPGLSGLDLLKQLRLMEAGGGARTPVLVFSADVTPEAIQQCERSGARAFLPKPVVASRLLDVLADVATNGKVSAPAAVRPDVRAMPTEVLDPQVLDELTALGMGEVFEREFIGQCLNDADGCIGGLTHAMEGGSNDRMREHAHALKGVASNLGLIKLAAASDELMRLPDWQVAREWRQRVAMLNAHLSNGRDALSARERQRKEDQQDHGERS